MDGHKLKDHILEQFTEAWQRPMSALEITHVLSATFDVAVVRLAVRQLVDEERLTWRRGYELGEWTWQRRSEHGLYHVPPQVLREHWDGVRAAAPWLLAEGTRGTLGRFSDEKAARVAAEQAGAALRTRVAWREAKKEPERGRVLEHIGPGRVWRPVCWVYEEEV